MRIIRPGVLLFLLCSGLTSSTSAQNTSSSTGQAPTAMQQAVTALAGTSPPTDVTLTGTAERIVGSDEEFGTATYRALPSASRLDLSLSGGTRTEVRASGANGPAGNWVGPDGTAHEISQHNLLTEAGWFPLFTLTNVISANSSALVYIGPETKNGVSVTHIQSTRQSANVSTSGAPLWQHLTQLDIYLDATTHLPVALDFNTHPDNNAVLDIPVEFRFSDYRTIGSLNIPFHVQQFLNGSLLLDVQFQQATVNSGLASSSSIFAIQ